MMYKSTLQKLLFCVLFISVANYTSAQCVNQGTIASPACGATTTISSAAGGRMQWTLQTVSGANYTLSLGAGSNCSGAYSLSLSSITNATGGNYTVDVYAGGGCNWCSGGTSSTLTYTRVRPTITNSLGNVCETSGGITFTASLSGGTWSESGNGNINASTGAFTVTGIAAPNVSETYSVGYTAAGCAAPTNATGTVYNQPTLNIGAGPICENGTAAATTDLTGIAAVPSSGSVTSGVFTPADVAVPNASTTVTFTASNGNCGSATNSPSIVVGNRPTISLGAGPICENATATATTNLTGVAAVPSSGSVTSGVFTPADVAVPNASTTVTFTAPNNGCAATNSPSIVVGNRPTISVGAGPICETATATATTDLTGVAAVPSSGSVTSGVFTPADVAVPNASTTVTFTAPNNGCTATNSPSIVVGNRPTITVGASAICESGTTTAVTNLTGVAAVASAGSVSSGTFNPPGVSAPALSTSVTFTAPNNGCAATNSPSVQVDNVPVITIGATAICENSTTTAVTNLTGLAPVPTSGSVSSGVFTPATFAAPTQFQTITFSRTNGQCTATPVNLQVDNMPNTADAGPDIPQCNNTNFVMAANTNDITGGTSAWTCVTNCAGVSFAPGTSNTQTVSGVPAGTGSATTMQWTLANGQCSTSDQVDLRNYQSVSIGGTSQICDDNTGVTFTSTPSGLTTWSVSGGGSISSGGIYTPNDVAYPTATQPIVVSLTNGSCSNTYNATVYNLPDNNTPTTSMCEGETRNLLSSVTGVTWISSPCGPCVSGSVFTAPNPGGASANYNIIARNGGSFCQSGTATITVYTVATITSSNADMCEGQTRALTANLTPGTFSGTGVSGTNFTAPSVAVPTTPHVIEYVLNGAPASCKATQTINVLNQSDNPTGASVSATPVCNGSSVDLTLTGGGNGANENVRWYTGSPGGTLVGTGNPLNVTPPSTATTTYYGRYEDGAPCSYNSGSQSTSVTTEVAPTAASSLSTTPNSVECVGNTATVTVVGGTLGTSGVWKLYSGSCGGTLVGSNGTGIFNVTPLSSTNYYARAEGCNNTACVNATVTANAPVDLIPGTGVKTCTFNGTISGEKFLVNASNEALLSIDEGTVDLGNVTATVTKHGSVPAIAGSTQCDEPLPSVGPVGGDELYLPREFDITTSNVPSGYVTVSLYFTQAELTDLRNATLAASAAYQSCWGTVANDGSNLMLTINHTDNTYETRTQGGGGLTITPSGGPNSSYKATFQVNKFSGFKFHGNGGVNGANGLPVEMIYFEASPVNNAFIQLTWATALEIDNDGFQVERSEDGQTWNTIGWVDGGNNSTVQLNYSFDDFNVVPGVRYYYRLKQIDNDGDFAFYGPKTAIINGEITFDVMDLVPNPTMNATSFIVTATKEQQITVEVFDVIGQKLSSDIHSIAKKANTISVDCSKFAAGTYTVTVTSGNQIYTKKLVIAR